DDPADLGDLSWLYNQLGSSRLAQGDFDGAATVFSKEFELSRRLGEKSPGAVVSATNWAQLTVYIRHEGAEVLRLLPPYRDLNESLGGDPRTSAFIDGLSAEAALLEGEHGAAERLMRRALEVLDGDRQFRDDWWTTAVTLHARALARLGRVDEAEVLLVRSQPDSARPGSDKACVHRFASLEVALLGGAAPPAMKRDLDDAVSLCRDVSPPVGGLSPGLALAASSVRAVLEAEEATEAEPPET
ncbi:MAG: hypothetical protein AAFY88_21780, partial [Acidobacteriota bacterium]